MGSIRNGARTFLNLMAKACRLSHLPGFSGGIGAILGAEVAGDFFALWNPLCAFVDTLIAADNWYNQKDYTAEDVASEDVGD